ncbi:MAG: ZinT/AdcA family metal-binding protein, partial [Synergistaceae bacterium]|nr:ZinT/AdcA family metal-binding protein [Synergistaceae bacterium]
MKKLIPALFLTMLTIAVMAVCAQSADKTSSGGKLRVVASNFPPYDFARAVAGDKAEIEMLLQPGSESHTFDPTPQDIIKIQNCDVFIYGGGESDEWVSRVLESMDTSKMKIIALMDCVDAVEEEIVEGMQDDEDHSHDGVFEDRDVRDRSLADWKGDWQSGLPYVADGSLDDVFVQKAAHDDKKTAEEYKQYYLTGYQTDYDRLLIDGDSIAFYQGKQVHKSRYQYRGFVIMTYESGKKGVRYQFEAVGEASGAPKYLQFSDHNIKPTDVSHFHVYYGNGSFETMLGELANWPTYYPVAMTAKDIASDMMGHAHEAEYDEH